MERKRCFNILLILCAIAYGVSSIFYLVDDYDLWRNCNGGSHLWSYLLVSLCLLGNKRNLIMDQDDKLYVFFYCSLIEIGLACWGAIELFDRLRFNKFGSFANEFKSPIWLSDKLRVFNLDKPASTNPVRSEI